MIGTVFLSFLLIIIFPRFHISFLYLPKQEDMVYS
jgi:hypothetical protein